MSFKTKNSLLERTTESAKIIAKFSDRIPVICESIIKIKQHIPPSDKIKYLVPGTLTIGQFMFIIRKKINLSPNQALFLFVNGNIPSTSTIMNTLYKKDKDIDGFLYINYSGENTFG